jgi:hypothetical protein
LANKAKPNITKYNNASALTTHSESVEYHSKQGEYLGKNEASYVDYSMLLIKTDWEYGTACIFRPRAFVVVII